MKWLRLYTEIRRDPKLRRLPVSYRWVWITILCVARESPQPGWLLLRKSMPAQPADIADEANVSLDDATCAMDLFSSAPYEMLAEEDGVLRVVNWGKRQFENDSSAERTRRYRQRLNRTKLEEDARFRHSDGHQSGHGDGHGDITRDSGGDVSQSSQSPAYHQPQKNCGEAHRDLNEKGCNPTFSAQINNYPDIDDLQSMSGVQRHSDGLCDVTHEVACDGAGDVTENVSGDVTLQSYRVTEYKKHKKHSASQDAGKPQNSPESPVLSAPDGAVSAHLSNHPTSTIQLEPEDLERDATKLSPICSQQEDVQVVGKQSSALIHSQSKVKEPPRTEDQQTHGAPKSKAYLTKRKRKLTGWKLETFEQFWRTFGYKKGRAEAADAWLDVPNLSRELAARIIKAAAKEAKARSALLAKGRSPKWGQGWLSARRWEDWEENDADTHDQGGAFGAGGREEKHVTEEPGSGQEEGSEHVQSIRDAVKRFL